MHTLNSIDRRFEDGLDAERLLAQAGAFDHPAWDGGYKIHFRDKRARMRLRRMLKEERIWIDGWHLPSTRRRKLPWFEEIVAIMKDATDKGAQVHERIYRDALKRAEAADSQNTRFRKFS